MTLLDQLSQIGANHQIGTVQPILENSSWILSMDLECSETLSGSFRSIEIQGKGTVDLTHWAATIVQRPCGLRENLKVLEIDHLRGEAILRSEKPRHSDDKISYYELKLTRNAHAHLQRYEFDRVSSARRVTVPMILTHEVVDLLVVELITAGTAAGV